MASYRFTADVLRFS